MRTPSDYGLIESAVPGLPASHNRSRNCIYACSFDEDTHHSAVAAWPGTWTNDGYFGCHGGLYVADEQEHRVFKAEEAKVSAHVTSDGFVPFKVEQGNAGFNEPWGADYDRRAEFIMNVVRVYEATGDLEWARRLLPTCQRVIEHMSSRRDDPDGDLLLEGRSVPLGFSGPGACVSISYIGDTCKNDWKDFGASMFFFHALLRLARLEEVLGEAAPARRHRSQADAIRQKLLQVFWNEADTGFTAWIDKDGVRHDDWITGNNFHAIACGLATDRQAASIIATLKANRGQLLDVVPGRVRIGHFEPGYCSNGPSSYWNGGIWTLTTSVMMMSLAKYREWDLLLDIVDRLANKTRVTPYGFHECYRGDTGEPEMNDGLLMNNGGFLWGVFAGLYGVDFDGDDLSLRAFVPAQALPARAKLLYRGRDIDIRWQVGLQSAATFNGAPVACGADGCYRLQLPVMPGQIDTMVITSPANRL